MSWIKIKQKLIKLIPVKFLRDYLSWHYGWFPYNNVSIKANISNIKNLKLDGNVYIKDNVQLRCGRGIHIGENTHIAEFVYMISTNHNYNSGKQIPFDDTSYAYTIDIGKNCWIGAKAIICPGVKIEEGAIVATGSVVTKSVPKCSIVGGNPAKIIGWRDIEAYDKCVKQNNIYMSEPQKMIVVEEFKPYLQG